MKSKKQIQLFIIVISIMVFVLFIACDFIPITAYPHSNKADPNFSEGEYIITITKNGLLSGEEVRSIPPTADEGDVVTLTADINNGRLVLLNSDGAGLSSSRLIADGDTASFTMPAADVEVIADYTERNLENNLHASYFQAGDSFGRSVSISGDYAIIGAYYEDGGSGDPLSNSGAAYIYKNDGTGNWSEVQVLHAIDAQANDWFGCSVSISGDYAIVGALYEDGGVGDPVSSCGAAYIYKMNSNGVWSAEEVLHASDAQAADVFGTSVSISSDYAIVGADFEDGGSGDPDTDFGAAYIYKNEGNGIWSEAAILHASDLQDGDHFGASVSIFGNAAVVGAYTEDGGAGDPALDSGAAYIFRRNSGGLWVEEEIIRASDAQASDVFGTSVSISGDFVIIGAIGESGGSGGSATGAGAAYIYEDENDGSWTEVAALHASDFQAADYFGKSVCISGDYAIAGAYLENGGTGDPTADAGAAYLYKKSSSGTWTEAAVFRASDGASGDRFGFSVGISGYTAISGAYYEDGGVGDPTADAGAAYIISNLVY